MSGYKTVLGEASAIDAEERPYVIMSIEQNGNVEVSSCVKNGGQLLQMCMAAAEAFGSHCLGDENSSDAYEVLRKAGFTDGEINRITGLTALVTVALGTGNEEFKKHISSAIARAIDTLVVQNKTLSEAAAGAMMRSSQETRH